MNTFKKRFFLANKSIYLLPFLCLFGYISNSQSLENLTIEDGLPSSTVYNIFEDSLGFIWFATSYGVVKYDGYKFNRIDLRSIGVSNDIWEIYDDKQGKIWFSGEQKLVYLQNDSLHSVPFPDQFESYLINYHDIDEKGNHYIYFDGYPFKVETDASGKVSLIPVTFDNLSFHDCSGMSFIEEDSAGIFWYTRLLRGDYSIALCKSYDNKTLIDLDTLIYSSPSDHFKYLYQYLQRTASGNYFFAVEKGVFQIDLKREKIVPCNILPLGTKIKEAVLQNENISRLTTNKGIFYLDENLELIDDLDFTKNISANIVFEDSNKNVWFCTFDKGVYFLSGKNRQLQKVTKDTEGNDIFDICDSAQDIYGNIWFTNNSNKIWKLNKNNEVIPYDLSKYIIKEKEVIRYIEFDNFGNLYLSSSRSSTFIFAEKIVKAEQFNQKAIKKTLIDGKVPPLDLKKHGTYILRVGFIKHISKTKKGTILIGSSSRIVICKPTNPNNIEYAFLRKGRNYAATIWRGHLVLGKTNILEFNQLKGYTDSITLNLQLSIETLFTDNRDNLWIGTKNNGLYIYDGVNFRNISETSNLQLRTVHITQADNTYWISTNKGIARIRFESEDSTKYDFKLFTKENGLLASQVQETFAKGEKLYIATTRGINIVDTVQFQDSSTKSPLYFTDCILNGNDTLIDFNRYRNEYFSINHKINNLKIKFSCLPFFQKEYFHYEYRSKGIQDEWQRLDINLKEFNIKTLSFGKYTFEVRAKNTNGIVSDSAYFRFQTVPPWWKSWWAYACYFIAISSVIYFFVTQFFKRKKIQAENHTLASINKAKTNFFTNITHELRTPLTMIMGLTQYEQTKKSNQSQPWFSDLKVHTKTMLHLINQLLDISKLEVGATSLYLEIGDLVQFCKNIVSLFAQHAKTKHQKLHFYTNTNSFMTQFDAEKIERILYNILSNAIKYTHENGTIEVILEIAANGTAFQIDISDNGPGIDDELKETIFNKFSRGHKTSQSSGIGLYLAKELAKFIGGDIEFTSNKTGSIFTLTSPLVEHKKGMFLSQTPYELSLNKIATNENSVDFEFRQQENLPQLLLVDDNPYILNLLRKMLVSKYNIVIAQNGQEGLSVAQDIVPELIVSDIMMPKMDGYEFCQRLKEDMKTSHIPIILLSAKDTKEAQVKGISFGADAYIKKPFDYQEFLNIIESILLNRKKLRDRYLNLKLVQKKIKKDHEDTFVLRIKSIIEENLSNPNLEVTTLCNEMFISRTQLHHKLKYTTGISARRFIRKIRLERSRELLEQGDMKISSIAFEIGMDSKYFSRIFNKTYGESPSEYRKRVLWNNV